MAEFVYRPLQSVPADKLDQSAAHFLPLGIRLTKGETGPSIEIDEVDAGMVADVNAMLQVLCYLDVVPNQKGQVNTALQTYETLAQEILLAVSDEDDLTSLSGIRRSAVEHYPFFCDGQKLAQSTGLLDGGWDVFPRDEDNQKKGG